MKMTLSTAADRASRPLTRRRLLSLVIFACLGLPPASAAPASKTDGKLKVFFIDVEGGQATLFVTPTGQSLLIDTGWDGNGGRDADRIATTAKGAGLHSIDYVLITHFHRDHVGGVPQLVERIPVGTFVDHGENRELDHGITEQLYGEYRKVLAGGRSKHILARPGDVLPIGGMKATVISADGDVLRDNLPGAGQVNEACAHTTGAPADETENVRSVGVLIQFGALRILDLGDLTKDKERELVCPANKLGHPDVYVVSHHGWNQSSSPEFVEALQARVAIMDNGATKGGSLATLQTLRKAPGLESLWQVHFSEEGGPAWNTGEPFIANLNGPDAGHSLELVGAADGSFDVVNTRQSFTKHYAPRSR